MHISFINYYWKKKGKEKIAFEDFIRVSTFITEDIIVYVSCVLLHYK